MEPCALWPRRFRSAMSAVGVIGRRCAAAVISTPHACKRNLDFVRFEERPGGFSMRPRLGLGPVRKMASRGLIVASPQLLLESHHTVWKRSSCGQILARQWSTTGAIHAD